MKNTDIVHILPPEELHTKTIELFALQEIKLRTLLPTADIQHVGSGSIEGSCGKFDVDIQIRVTPFEFASAMETLKRNYESKHPGIWTDEFGLFADIGQPIDINLTVIDSPHDVYYKLRDFLITHPDTVEAYNNFKKSYEGKMYGEYREAKQQFLAAHLPSVSLPTELLLKPSKNSV